MHRYVVIMDHGRVVTKISEGIPKGRRRMGRC
jgi:hypothetical protein